MEAGGARRHLEQRRIVLAEADGADALDGAHRAVAGLLEMRVERRCQPPRDRAGCAAESAARSMASGVSPAIAQAGDAGHVVAERQAEVTVSSGDGG